MHEQAFMNLCNKYENLNAVLYIVFPSYTIWGFVLGPCFVMQYTVSFISC